MTCLRRSSLVSYKTISKLMNLPQRQFSILQIYQRQYSSTNYFYYSLSSSVYMPSSSSSSPSSTLITFLTDVEGDDRYFDRFIQHSKVLKFKSIVPSFGEQKYAADADGKNKWYNLGKWDEDYFPYDKEVVFIDNDDDMNCNKSMLVYGVSSYTYSYLQIISVLVY